MNNKDGYFMTTGQQVQLGFSAANDILSIFSTLNAGDSQANAYNFQAFLNNSNASNLRTEAKDILTYYQRQANISKEEGLRQRGEQRVAMGASGFDVSSKSYQRIINETDMNIANNEAYIREEAMSKYASAIYQSKMQDIQANLNYESARIAKSNAKTNARMSAISAAAKLGAIAYFGGK